MIAATDVASQTGGSDPTLYEDTDKVTTLMIPELTLAKDSTEERTITVWTYLQWRCEYWEGGGVSELRLYMGEQLVQLARPLDTFETLVRSASWHTSVPVPDPRSGLDRRARRRGGRRSDDQPA